MKSLFMTTMASLCLLLSHSAHGAEHRVRMLNQEGDETMLFLPAFVHAQVGDTVRFEPTQSGHYVRSLATPEKAEAWQSELDKPFTLTLTQEGLYFYMCPPHLMMGMVGLIQVGNPVNKAVVSKQMLANKGRMYSNSARIDSLLTQVK
ncbi:plastocyanin/azurin family copper-binding protein [Aeromonas veronii]|uniref:plastocyanin/azurin family copper-binding protein n=1 Tax=Aeromonas veronii TaxID=654 RepID=UPI0032ED647C